MLLEQTPGKDQIEEPLAGLRTVGRSKVKNKQNPIWQARANSNYCYTCAASAIVFFPLQTKPLPRAVAFQKPSQPPGPLHPHTGQAVLPLLERALALGNLLRQEVCSFLIQNFRSSIN